MHLFGPLLLLTFVLNYILCDPIYKCCRAEFFNNRRGERRRCSPLPVVLALGRSQKPES